MVSSHELLDSIIVNDNGDIVLSEELRARFRMTPGAYRLVISTDGLLVWKREDTDLMFGGGPRVLMAGELLSRTSVLEIINMISTSNWRGDLHITSDVHRVLRFDQGAIKHATSDHESERLGELLVRKGVLTRAKLNEFLSYVSPDKRLGSVLLQQSVLEKDRLFECLKQQVEEIFFGALLVREGTYVFSTPNEAADPAAATVHLPVQSLLMEGVQRIDEMSLFREHIPHGKMCPEVKPNVFLPSLDAISERVLEESDGRRTLLEIAQRTGLGEFEVTKAVYQLLQRGVLVLRTSGLDEFEMREMANYFNAIMRDIFLAVAPYGGVAQTRETLAVWIQGSGFEAYFGGGVNEDGTLDTDRLITALGQAAVQSPYDTFMQAMHELVAFALFAATTSLPREQELILARDVNHRLKHLGTRHTP